MSEARIHPPSEQRLSEARRLGHVPRAPLVGLFALWSSLLLGLSLAAPAFRGGLEALLRGPLEATAQQRPWTLAELWAPGSRLLASCAFVLLGAFVALALGTWISQGPAFGFAPASRLRLPALRAPRVTAVLFALGLPILCGQIAARSLRAEPSHFGDIVRDFALYAAAYLAACALLDAALARAAHVRSLWLTRREQRDEQREAYGSPELRRARARLRGELAREAKP